jgi:hypothetical protein
VARKQLFKSSSIGALTTWGSCPQINGNNAGMPEKWSIDKHGRRQWTCFRRLSALLVENCMVGGRNNHGQLSTGNGTIIFNLGILEAVGGLTDFLYQRDILYQRDREIIAFWSALDIWTGLNESFRHGGFRKPGTP